MKKRVILSLIAIIILTLTSCSSNKPKSLEEYNAKLDLSCQLDSDCSVKNIGNCCGNYPKCVNKNFTPDLDSIKDLCEKEKSFSICGFDEIKSCKCINNKCDKA